MTLWRPLHLPNLAIYYGESTNTSGMLTLVTPFRKIITCTPVATGSSYAAVQATGFTYVASKNGAVRIFVNGSRKQLNGSQAVDVEVWGVV